MKKSGITLRQILWIGVVAAAYYAAGWVGLLFSTLESTVSPFWLPSGVALAAVLLLGRWVWPGILLGSFLINYNVGPSDLVSVATVLPAALVALAIAAGNAAGVIISVILLDRLGFDRKIGRVRDAVLLLVVAAPFYSAFAATVGATSLGLSGIIGWSAYWGVWQIWWMGDTIGIMLFTPFLIAWSSPIRFDLRQFLEGTFLIAVLGIFAGIIFRNGGSSLDHLNSFPYILFPLTLWVALRFGMRGASFAVFLVASIAAWGTVQGLGPFASEEMLDGLLLLDSYIAVLSISVLLIVAILNDRLRIEDEHNRFFSLSIDMLCIANADGYFKKISPAFEKTLGWSTEEMTSRPFISFVHPDDVAPTQAEVKRQMIAGEKVLQLENRYRHKDGSWRVLSWKSVPQGKEMYATARDVTRRREVEAALRESEERFHTMADSIPQLAWMAHPNGDIFWYNQQWYDYTGTTLEQMYGWGWQSVHDPAELPRVVKKIKACFESGEPWEDTFPLRRHDGVYRWHLSRMRAIKDEQGNVLQWFGTNTDITAAKESEETIHRNSQKLSVILDSIAEAVMTTDTEGYIRSMNPIAEKLTGWTFSRSEGLHIEKVFQIINARTREPMPVPIAAVLRTGTKKGMANHKLLITLDGKERHVAYSASPLRLSETEMLGVVIVCRDVSEERTIAQAREEIERHRAESDKLAREAAESASRSKSAFVASMSHEIRTPMNAILGFAQILQRDTSLTPQQAANVGTINRAGLHLLALVDDILDISKIEAGRILLSPFVFSLHDLLDDLETLFHSRCEAKGLQLLIERDKSVPQYAEADEAKLRQIFINLLGNAVKFTEQGGVAMRVRCNVTPTVVDAAITKNDKPILRLMVEIDDTGFGIAKEEIGKLFKNFEQTSAGAKVGGTGLGLAISKKLAQLMGGDISVRSEVGKGTCFRFNALMKTADALVEIPDKPAQRKIIGLQAVASPIRALIVDDNADNRALLRALLEPLGIELCEAVNGREALAVIDSFNPTVILMDMRMPDMDGYEATRLIRETEAGKSVRIIAVTASAFDDAESQVLQAGMDAYIRKPFRNEHLFETLGRLLDLKYEYAEVEGDGKTSKLNAEQMKSLPDDLLSDLRQVLAEGDMGKMSEVIPKVSKVDEKIARQLQELAENFEYESLNRLVR